MSDAGYLVSGRLPPRGAVCHPDQAPFGPTTAAQVAAQSSVEAIMRPMLPETAVP